MRRILLPLLAAALLAGPSSARAADDGGLPLRYADTSGLSQPVFTGTHQVARIPMRDGVGLYSEIYRPSTTEPVPAIVEISPNTRDRVGNMPDLPKDPETGDRGNLVNYFVPRGFAVVIVDARGTRDSDGCSDILGPTDATDGYDVVEWVAARPWSNHRVAVVGSGTDGSLALAAASAEPPHLVTAVVVNAVAQTYDETFQGGVPYQASWLFSPTGFDDPGWFRALTRSGCNGLERAAATGPDHVTGRRTDWHAERDYRAAAAAADVPFFVVHGLENRIVHPIALDWMRQRGVRDGDKLWLGWWGHDPSDRAREWPGILHRWLERHLLPRPDVQTGPPVEVFLNPKYDIENVYDLNDPENYVWRGKVRTATTWPPETSTLTLYPTLEPSSDPAARLLSETAPPEDIDFWLASTQGRGMIFTTEPFTADTVFAGFPEITLNVTIGGERVDLIVSLYEVGGANRQIMQATLNPELRDGLESLAPVVPGVPMRLRLPAQPHDYMVHEGSRLRMFITSNDQDKFPSFAGPAPVLVHFGGPDPTRIELGRVVDPALYEDPRPKAEPSP